MTVYAFGPFELDISQRWLRRGAARVAVSGKTFDILRLLVEAGGRLVERETFAARLWPGGTVENRNLTVHISILRKLLNYAASPANYIETVAKAGYRLAVPVRLLAADGVSRPATEAHRLQLEARVQLAKRERLPAMRALGLFERALALDPGEAAAHAGLASTYLFLASTMIRRPLPLEEAAQLARESAERALGIDDREGEAYAVLGQLKMFHDWDWPGADADLERAVAVAPNSAVAADAQGWLLCAMGHHAAAGEALKRARLLDPSCRETVERLGLAQWVAGDGERAIATLAEASSLDPEARRPHFRRMVVLDQLGHADEAMAERMRWLRLFGEEGFRVQLGELHRRGGYRAAMVKWIDLLERLNQWWEAALQWMAIDEPGRALDALERCLADRGTGAPFLRQYPSLRPLHQKPRFRTMVRTMGLS